MTLVQKDWYEWSFLLKRRSRETIGYWQSELGEGWAERWVIR